MKKTNFDIYLKEQMKNPVFAEHYARAGQALDVALQIVALRKKAGLSQKDLAKVLKTSQQQVSRLESASYEGHSLSMLRRVADALHARVRIVFEPVEHTQRRSGVAEDKAPYLARPRSSKSTRTRN